MGADGAALGNIIAHASGLIVALLYIKRKGLGFSLTRKDIRFDRRILSRILKVGAPISLQESLIAASFLFITAIISRMGAPATASVGVVERIIGMYMMPAIAMASAVAAMASHNIGAGELRRAEKCMWTGILISLAFSIPATAVTWLGTTALVSIFSNEADVIHNAALYLRSYVFDTITVSFVFVLNGFFNSLNRSLFAMIHSLIVTFLIRIPFVLLLADRPDVTLFSIGFAAPLSSFASIIICLAYLTYLKRKDKLIHHGAS